MDEKITRKQIRLKNYNYANSGYYFITICTNQRKTLFGEIKNNKMLLNNIGEIIYSQIKESENKYPKIIIDENIVMPNHIHIIINILENNNIPIGNIIGYFKYQSSKAVCEYLNIPIKSIWQRNYYEHIIKDEIELNNTREYIKNNPQNWQTDKEYLKQ